MITALVDLLKWLMASTPGVRTVFRRFDLRTSSQRRDDQAVAELIGTLTNELTLDNLRAVIDLREEDGVREGSHNVVTNGNTRYSRMHMLETGITVPQHPARYAYGVQRNMHANSPLTPPSVWYVEFLVFGLSEQQQTALKAALDAMVAHRSNQHLATTAYEGWDHGRFNVKVTTHIAFEPARI